VAPTGLEGSFTMPTPRFRKLAAARLAVSEPISPAVSSLFDGEGGASALSTRQVPVARLAPLPGQPARPFNPATLASLAQSISEHGVLEPLLVRPVGAGGYQIIAGERRWRAAILAGLEKVPAVVREMDDLTALQTAIGESLGRIVDAQPPVVAAPVAEPVTAVPVAATVVEAPLVATPVVTPVATAPVVAAPVAPVVTTPVAVAPVVEVSAEQPLAEGEGGLLDRIGSIWAEARDLAAAIDAERGELSSYERERARKALLSIRIVADNGVALLRD
jgi:hypothetical protein